MALARFNTCENIYTRVQLYGIIHVGEICVCIYFVFSEHNNPRQFEFGCLVVISISRQGKQTIFASDLPSTNPQQDADSAGRRTSTGHLGAHTKWFHFHVLGSLVVLWSLLKIYISVVAVLLPPS